jgi:sec-independent protein translocase protein TatB
MGTPPPIQQANLGMADSFLLLVLALVVFGPRRLPQIGRQIGKLMYEFRKASNDFKFQMEEELRTAEDADRRKREEEQRQQRLALAAQSQAAETKTDAAPAGAQADTGSAHSADPAPGISAAASEAPQGESAPRIMPPSVGKTVAAARAGRAGGGSPSARVADPPGEEPAEPEPKPVTEQASHNG